MKSRDLSLEARAWYNIGNCAFSEAQRQVESDLEKALESYRESVGFYQTALEKDPDLGDAAHNLEVARLMIKDLLDQIQKQKEAMDAMRERLKAVVDSLVAAIKAQEEIMAGSLELSDDQRRRDPGWKDEVASLTEDERDVRSSTAAVQDSLRVMFGDQPPEQVAQAASHLDTALVNQDDAVVDLASEETLDSAVDQEQAIAQMKKAQEKLTENDQQNQKGQNKEQDQQGQQQQDQKDPQDQQQEQQPQEAQQEQKPPRNETARSIIDEEKENRKKRKQNAARGHKKVEKDW